ncbi:MAG TPA: hypothetical protein VGR80_02975 [Steroidobacteraceae bacterium]|nr:hypothetical protein [Steroidobacteraceae bacterium]
MPKVLIYETRRLTLPLETVVDAVLELDRERGGRLAMASIVDARIEEGENAGLILEVLQPDAVAADARRYPLAAIAAAVIHYCWKTRVPLPRNWQKSIEIVPEGFALALQGTTEIQRRHGGVASASQSEAGDADETAAASAEEAAADSELAAAEAPVSR